MKNTTWWKRTLVLAALAAAAALAVTTVSSCYPKCYYDPQYHRNMPIPCQP